MKGNRAQERKEGRKWKEKERKRCVDERCDEEKRGN